MRGLDMVAEDVAYALCMIRDAESTDLFWCKFSEQANTSLMQELEDMQGAYLNHLAKHHFKGELIRSEKTFYANKYKKVLVFVLAGLLSLNENVVPSLCSDTMDAVRRGYGFSGAIERHRSHLRSFGNVNKQFVDELTRIAEEEAVCSCVEGFGFIYGLGVAWIMAMKKDDPSLIIPIVKASLARMNDTSAAISVSPKMGSRLATELEEILKG